MLVRAATTSDSHGIAALHAASWRYAYRGALSDEYLAGDVESDRRQLWESRLAEPTESQRVLLVEDGVDLLGFACVYIGEDPQWGSYLNNIHVVQATQGRGIGRLLLNATAEVCSKSHSGGLYLWVLQSNTRAQGFYARHGGENTGTDIWEAPGGTTAPLFRFSWESLGRLQEATANPSIALTSSGVLRTPPAAAHLKRYARKHR
jgi:ribosomal protein S18 acetylase RimI-like enzyme